MFKWLFKRRPPDRRTVDIATTAQEANGFELQVRFVNLSARGFRLKGSDSFREDSQLSIMLPGYGEVVGRVVWVKSEECGGMFLTPIPIDEIRLAATAA